MRKAGDPVTRSPAFLLSSPEAGKWADLDLGGYGSKSLAGPCLYAAGLQATGGRPAATRQIGDASRQFQSVTSQ
jgi:hypothetical protein